jgi:DNA-binding LytR/AlgR family response regulator
MKLKCFAVDDEPLALALIKSYVERTPFLQLAGAFSNAVDAAVAMKAEPVDLLFLDIRMPGLTGLQLASMLDAYKTKIIFTTAYSSYALDGFRVDAIDYLLKPISYEDFLKSAQKAQRYIEPPAPAPAPAATQGGSIVVRTNRQLMRLDFDEILYVEAMRDYVIFYTESGDKLSTQATLKGIASQLPEAQFAYVHRSFIVNRSKIKVVERSCIVFGKTRIPVSPPYRDVLLEIGEVVS